MIEDLMTPWIRSAQKSEIQKALEMTTNPDVISFSLGRPDNNFLDLTKLKVDIQKILIPKKLQYSPPSTELKAHIVKLMHQKNVHCSQEQIFLTTGAQQAMTLLVKLFASSGDSVLVDQLTYPGFIQIAEAANVKLIPIPISTESGLDLEFLKRAYSQKRKPRFMYTISSGHNPLGSSLTIGQCKELVNFAETCQFPVIEDDAYGFLNYDGETYPLKSYWNDGVMYIGSFSKILAPSLRVGWIVAPEPMMEKLEILKEGLDINTNTFSHAFINEVFSNIDVIEHIATLRDKYRSKRDLMVNALKKYIPEMEFAIPSSGFFIWGKLPPFINTNRLFELALEEEDVAFLPGTAFLIGGGNEAHNCLRLSYAFCPFGHIEPGIIRLADALKKYKRAHDDRFLKDFSKAG